MAFLLALALAGAVSAFEVPNEMPGYNSVADPQAVVVSGKARFSILTDRLIRMEFDNDEKWRDAPTLAFLNRKTSVPHHTATTSDGILKITTASVVLAYKVDSPFSASTLSVSPVASIKKKKQMMMQKKKGLADFDGWKYGDTNTGNLLGTIKSLDQLGVTSLNCTENANITVHGEKLHCAWGLISKDGWSLVDDSATVVLDDAGYWHESSPAPSQSYSDLYVFAHGPDFKGALADFVAVSGRTAMVPRYASGVWWTRWFNLNSEDTRDIVEEYESRSLPLDVFVLDMVRV
jgi:hypothetical protein